VAGAIDDPGDPGIGSVLGAQLDHAQSGGPDEIGPPLVVLSFRNPKAFPLLQGGSARQDDVFLAGCGCRLGSAWREAQREGREEEDSNQGHTERWLS
jgi:hypothetical protein